MDFVEEYGKLFFFKGCSQGRLWVLLRLLLRLMRMNFGERVSSSTLLGLLG